MVKEFSLIILLLSLSNEGYAQPDYFEYHHKINEAEAFFTQEELDRSLSIYDSIFTEYDYVFVKDLIVAAQISLLNKEYHKTTAWLRKAIANGYDCRCIEKINVFKDYVKSDSWLSIIEEKEKLLLNYWKNIDVRLHYEFHKRYKTEQESKSTAKYSTIVNNNYQRIKMLIDSIPFPSERLIGLDNDSLYKTTKGGSLNSCDASNSKVLPTLLHYDHPISDIGWDKFLTAIRSGDLHPREFAYIYSFETNNVSKLNKHNSDSISELPKYIFNYAFGKKTKDITRANLDRSEFGISSIGLDKAKIEFAKKYGVKLSFGYK